MSSLLRASILFAAFMGAGCSGPVVDDIADANGGMTQGIVLVERIASGDGATQTNVSAKFMRLGAAADSELAERVVGSRLDLPALDECMTISSGAVDGVADSLASMGPIELIDVGDVTLHAGASTMTLGARAFPDVGDLVSGVFYTSRDATSELPAGETYVLEGTGAVVVDRFSIEADAPRAPEDVRVGDMPLVDGVMLEEGTPATVRWRVDELSRTARGRGDLVLIDVRASSGAAVRCAFKDDGEAIVPAEVVRAATRGAPSSAIRVPMTLAVHRVRQRSFGTMGIDAGEVRFDFSVIGRATIAPRSP